MPPSSSISTPKAATSGLVFFGAASLAVGWLVIRSGGPPRLLGALLAGAGAVYPAGSALRLLAPALSEAVAPACAVPILAETGCTLWLPLRGVSPEGWRRS